MNDPTASFVSGDRLFDVAIQFPNPPPPVSYDVKGVIGGVQLGYNWQLSSKWLIGLETDFNGTTVKGAGISVFMPNFDPGNITVNQRVDWFGTARARLGFIASERFMMYGTGGLAYGSIKNEVSLTATTSAQGLGFQYICAPNGGHCFEGSSSTIGTGYTAGGGFEYQAFNNVTFKVEYLYVNLGTTSTRSVGLGDTPTPKSSFVADFTDLHFNTLRVGANYRF